jgi:hypothetical protein
MVQHILSPSYSTIVCKYDITFNYTPQRTLAGRLHFALSATLPLPSPLMLEPNMSEPIPKHALDGLQFTADSSVADRTAACKEYLRAETAMIKMRHKSGASGT